MIPFVTILRVRSFGTPVARVLLSTVPMTDALRQRLERAGIEVEIHRPSESDAAIRGEADFKKQFAHLLTPASIAERKKHTSPKRSKGAPKSECCAAPLVESSRPPFGTVCGECEAPVTATGARVSSRR